MRISTHLRQAWLAALLSLCMAAGPRTVCAQSLMISAAASLSESVQAIGAQFEAAHPPARLQYNLAASGVLLQQIINGAPVDVFISADPDTVQAGIRKLALAHAGARAIASNTLVLIAPLDSKLPTSLTDLRLPGIRHIAIGKPDSVPVGRYTREALIQAGLWDELTPRLVDADSVRQVLDYVARGEADAGLVYKTDAQLFSERVRLVSVVEGHAPVTYWAAAVVDSRHAELARAFLEFLVSPQAQLIFQHYGFSKP